LSILRSSVHFGIPRTLDIKKIVRVQAWIDMPFGAIVKNMYDGAFWSLLLFFGVLLWASFSSWEMKDPNKVRFGKMFLNKEAKKVVIDGKECPLRNQEFQLLLMFVEKPDHALSREEIKNVFWKEELGVDNRVSNLLSTLRNALKEFPEYQILAEEKVVRLLTKSL
jgi:DNA-binding response OmpR family regulator